MSRRWTLRSISVLKHHMAHPGRVEPFSVRTLAKESGVGQGVVEKLLTGRQLTADINDAIALAETLGVAINPLFAPPSSPEQSHTSRKIKHTSKE